MGNKVIRLLVVVGVAIFGFAWTLACDGLVRMIDWPLNPNRAWECREIDHCDLHWTAIVQLLLFLFGPALAFSTIVYWGMRRGWRAWQWVKACLGAPALTLALYFAVAAYYAFV